MSVKIEFDEILLDGNFFGLGAAKGSPEFANSNIRSPISGLARVAILRYDALIVYNCEFNDVDSPDGVEYLNQFWRGGFGSAYGFRVRLESDYFAESEVISTSDGTRNAFLLTKTYNRPGTTGHPDIRRIIKPVVSSSLSDDSVTLYEADGVTPRVIEDPIFRVYWDDVERTTGWKISNTTGTLTFTMTFTADSSNETITLSNHGFSDGDKIKVANSGGALPAPLAAGTTYFVRDVTTNTFKLAATLGGAAINLTTNGTGTNSVTGPPIDTVISVDMTFDTPMQFWVNSFQQEGDFPSKATGLQLVELLPISLGIT